MTLDPPPIVVTIDMGYGHLRAAQAVADVLGVPPLLLDKPPLADADDERSWTRSRSLYEATSRLSQVPLLGAPFRGLLDGLTAIPHLHPLRDLSAPHVGVQVLDRAIQRGLGAGLVRYLERSGAAMVTTFYAPAIIADRAGLPNIYCVVTDADINRVWAPLEPGRTRIQYLAPTQRAKRRLEAYGVPSDNIHVTGFPLPDALLGGPTLARAKANLAARLVRLDPEGAFQRDATPEIEHFLGPLTGAHPARRPPHLTFAVGGAGAQADVARRFLPSLRGALASGRLRLTLVAGLRPAVADLFVGWLREAGMTELLGHGVDILLAPDFASYYAAFNAALARTDILWTKPSELTFYGALGVPLVLSWPVGVHERYNRRWAIENGAGIKQRDPRYAGEWLHELLADGTFAAAAWHGFTRMPKFGTHRLAERLGSPTT